MFFLSQSGMFIGKYRSC